MRYEGLTTGAARYAGDLRPAGLAHLVFVRSPHAHARIVSIDTSSAVGAPGVVGVFTAADLNLVPLWEIHMIPEELGQPPLATGEVRYVGERVVAVLAHSLAQAIDAAELVDVTYASLPLAMVPGAPGTKHFYTWNTTPAPGVLDGHPLIVSGQVHMPRVANAPIEPLAITAVPEANGRTTLHVSTQSPQSTAAQAARSLGVNYFDLRAVVPRVGGSFGGKAVGAIPDYALAAALAHRLRVPVRCVEDRSSNLTCMQGRGMTLDFELHADAGGRVQAIRVHEDCDSGAYPVTNSVEPGKTQMMITGPYRLDHVAFDADAYTTNGSPSGAYRGPGRSEASAVLERGMDLLAQRLGIDPVEIRRRNLLRADELPRESVTGAHYDEGDYHRVLDVLIERSHYDSWRAEQANRRAAGARVQLGIGLSTVTDSSAWFARHEDGIVEVAADGTVTVVLGSAAVGQEHEVVFANLVASVLPVRAEDVVIVAGDTDRMGGFGSSGSRTIQMAGTIAHLGALDVLAKAHSIAAELLEAAEADIETTAGGFVVRGVPSREIAWREVAALAASAGEPLLDTRCAFDQPGPTYAFGAQLSIVEVDTETGEVRPLHHYAVTDCGRVIDPPGAQGQVIGGSVQGISQALFEEFVYDADGNPLTANFAEYLVPSAADMCPIDNWFVETPTSRNPLGAKGVGEIGMVAAPAAAHAAVLDALQPYGVDYLPFPASPQRVWSAIKPSS